jgi:lactoylglutathione lyase
MPWATEPAMISIEQFDHLGIRIIDRARSIAFYEKLGFKLAHESDFDAVVILKNAAGVELNLIINGIDATAGKNILMDVPTKHPGLTHIALRVADMRHTIAMLKENDIAITQGPVTFGDGHVSVFVRDPDRTVIELRARLDPGAAERIEGLTFYDPKG